MGCLLLIGVSQQVGAQTRVRRVGILAQGEFGSVQRVMGQQVADALKRLGWLPGTNVEFDIRADMSSSSFDKHADELVRRKVDVICTAGEHATRAAMRATTTIPIVFDVGGDPVSRGFVASLARPGGNVTGMAMLDSGLIEKRAQMLRELLPRMRTIGLLEPEDLHSEKARLADRALYASLGMQPVYYAVQSAAGYEAAIDQAARQGVDAVFLKGIAFPNPAQIADAGLNHRLPLMGEDPRLVDAGVLLSISPDPDEEVETMAYFIDQILKGTKPAGLPVRMPTRFEICVNLKTAKLLGVAVPETLIARATRLVR
jgi:putative ABC transport system substrate-binding protein